MSTFTDLKDAQRKLVAKALDLVICVAPYGTAIPQAITEGSSSTLVTLPPEWKRLGLVSKSEGVVFSSSTETDEIESYGELDPTRIDISKVSSTAKFVPQQLTKTVLSLYHNINLDGVTGDAVTGETRFKNASSPEIRYYSMIFIGKDGSDELPVFVYKILPRASVTGVDDESWTPQTALTKGITVTANKDDEEDTTVIHGFAGAGWDAIRAAAGFGDPASEVQVITLPTATAGTFTLTFNGESTSGLPFNAASSAVQTALLALPSIGAGNATVAGSAGGPYTVTFAGALAETDVPKITGSGSGLTPSGTVTVTVTTEGSA